MSNLRFSAFRQINTTLTADTFEPVVDASQLNDLSYWLIIVWDANSWCLKVLLYEHSGEEWTSSESLSLFLINEADVSSSGCRTVFLFFFLSLSPSAHTEAAVVLSQLCTCSNRTSARWILLWVLCWLGAEAGSQFIGEGHMKLTGTSNTFQLVLF